MQWFGSSRRIVVGSVALVAGAASLAWGETEVATAPLAEPDWLRMGTALFGGLALHLLS